MGKVLEQLRYHIFVCDMAGDLCSCEENGGGPVRDALKKRIAVRRLAPYVKTTIFTCNQPGAHGPVLVVYPDGIWYDGLTLDDIDELIDRQIIEGKPLERLLMQREAVAGHVSF